MKLWGYISGQAALCYTTDREEKSSVMLPEWELDVNGDSRVHNIIHYSGVVEGMIHYIGVELGIVHYSTVEEGMVHYLGVVEGMVAFWVV